MIPVSYVGVSSARPLANLAPTLNSRTDAPLAEAIVAPTPLPAAGVFDNSRAIMQAHSAVPQLLQGIDGAVENDKTLQMLIGLIILLWLLLLENPKQNTGSAPTGLSQLAAGGNSQPQFVGVYSSSTTTLISQTATTMFVSTMDKPAVSFDTGQPEPQGSQIDLFA